MNQNRSYYNRTALFVDQLMNGNISLKLFRVKLSDAGRYTCIIDSKKMETSIQLIVGAVSSPFIEVVTNNSEHLVLQCASTGWYPEPEVFWLDGEGNLLSAGPTETVRGPDDLYTVSSRVTVEKRHSNSFTCRVHQNHINRTRESHILVPDIIVVPLPVPTAVVVGLAAAVVICVICCKSHLFSYFMSNYYQSFLLAVLIYRDSFQCTNRLYTVIHCSIFNVKTVF
uniref:Ig-like domain-containing protein n=1 Tax=Sparus aurata TaxID=8175 RepID=A0A671TRH9_SPAAU